MAPTNNFLPFCPTDTGTNLLSQGDYAVATDRTNGNQPGIASAKLVNKAVRQSSFMTSQLAQFLANKTGADVLDADGVEAKLLALMNSALLPQRPVIQKFLSGTGTMNKTYVFTVTSGAATAGATYTNNGVTYTVVETIAAGTTLLATGSGAPLVSGTLTKSGGSGDATLTFHAVRAPLYLKVKLVGAGGGGAGGGSGGGIGGTGGTTTFGTTLLSAVGGTGGGAVTIYSGGAGGTASLGTGPFGIALTGGTGSGADEANLNYGAGGSGASTPFGGQGGGGGEDSAGNAAAVNTGAGGGGGGSSNGASHNNGGGGGAGGFIDAMIASPLATYDYAVGAAGTAGTAGAKAGGAGGSGIIIVEEHYQ